MNHKGAKTQRGLIGLTRLSKLTEKTFLGAPWWVWLAALAPRLVLCALAADDPARLIPGDGVGYLTLARNLVARGVFSAGAGPFPAETFRTPGYPLFLAPFVALFPSPALPIALAQGVLGTATAAYLWRFLNGRWGPRAAAAGALILAWDLVTLFHTPLVAGETLFVLLVTAAAARTWEQLEKPAPRGAALCGALWAASSFVRPISFYLPVFLIWIWRSDKKSLACFLLAAYLAPAAWIIRNGRETGVAQFTTVGGVALIRYTAAGIESLRVGRPLSYWDVELRAAVDRAHPEGFASEAAQSRAYGKSAAAIIKAHPLLLAKYCAWGLAKTMAGTGLEMLPQLAGVATDVDIQYRVKASGRGTLGLLGQHPWLIPLQAAYMAALAALYLSSAAGLWKLWTAGRRVQALYLGLCLGYFMGLSSSQGYYRYRIPSIPFLAIAAAAAAGFRPPQLSIDRTSTQG